MITRRGIAFPRLFVFVAAFWIWAMASVADEPLGQFILRSDGELYLPAAITHDGSRILSYTENGAVRIWNAMTGRPVGTRTSYGDLLSGGMMLPDERMAILIGSQGIHLFDVERAVPVGVPIPSAGAHWRNSVSISRNGAYIATAADGVRVWRTLTGAAVGRSLGLGAVDRVAVSDDGRRLAVSEGRVVTVWDVVTGSQVGAAMRHPGRVFGVDFAPDGRRLATTNIDADLNGYLQVWDANTGKETDLRVDWDEVGRVRFSRDGGLILAFDGEISYVVNVETAATGWGGPEGARFPERPYAPDRTRFLLIGYSGALLYEAESGDRLLFLRHETHEPGREFILGDAFFSPDGEQVATVGLREVRVWDMKSGEFWESPKHDRRIVSAAFTVDGTGLVTATEDSRIRIWKLL